MNQSVLFPDLQEWNSQDICVDFPAQVQGVNVQCRIGLASLMRISNSVLHINDHNISVKALALFNDYRFDIEEEVEMLIEQEAFDEHGCITL
ncbi:DUF1488 domain-containing protein [uncultured Shewanella sp.]|uniref:DUF1488 domain-containing protein n=1 Tax=uncultured Shewanella sp. TaxID=173975 RepID=UPI0026167730|nr:DUF1488 domain-containing protein [uncultured Shewanella sp.]